MTGMAPSVYPGGLHASPAQPCSAVAHPHHGRAVRGYRTGRLPCGLQEPTVTFSLTRLRIRGGSWLRVAISVSSLPALPDMPWHCVECACSTTQDASKSPTASDKIFLIQSVAFVDKR